MLFRCCVDTLFCCFTDVLFCWLSVLLFCGHIDLRIPVGYIGLERQQGFGRCPHSCLGKGWPTHEWRRPDKHTAGTAEAGRTPQKPPQSINLYRQISSRLKHEENGQQIDLRWQRGLRTVDERWARERETRHTAEAWFFSFPSVASSKAGRSEYDNLFREEKTLLRAAFLCGNPTGA